MRLIRLSNKNDECWGHLPALRRSLEDAGVRFHQKGIGALLDRMVAAFVMEGHPEVPLSQQGQVAAWYMIDDDGTIRGQLLAVQDQWDTEPCVYVNQLWAPNTPVALQRQAAHELDDYARSRGARCLFMYTRRHSPRYWKRAFGFEPHRVLYRREIT